MFTVLIFIAVLAVLVISHEFGHFITARKSGMKVDEFGFGFPPRIYGIRKLSKISNPRETQWQSVWGGKNIEELPIPEGHTAGTLYSFNLLPLGGFVKIKGEDATAHGGQDSDSFASKSAWKKTIVIVAGVFMNVVVAFVFLTLAYGIGSEQPIDPSADLRYVTNRYIEVEQVLSGMPAEQVGIKVQDRIMQVGSLKNPRLTELQDYVNAHKDGKISVTVIREGKEENFSVQPTVYKDSGKAGLGVGIAEIGKVKYPWHLAVYHGAQSTLSGFKAVFVGFFTLLKSLFMGKGVGGDVSGPVGVAVMTGKVARLGIVYLLQFMALLSLNLAVLNILPIPALDGGRLLFVIIAKIIGRPVTPKIEQVVHGVGFLLLMALVLFITVHDLVGFRTLFK